MWQPVKGQYLKNRAYHQEAKDNEMKSCASVYLHCCILTELLRFYWFCTQTFSWSRFLSDRLQNGSPYAIRPFSVCLSDLSVCNVRALWPNGWTDQHETWHAGRPRPWPHCVRWAPISPSPKGAHPPSNFRSIPVAAKWLYESRCHLVWS